MRTYSNGTKAKKTKANFFKKNMYAIILGASLLVVAAVITLTLTLGRKNVIETPPNIDTNVPPKGITFVNPLKTCVLKTDAALNKLVWNSTLRQWRTHNGVDFHAALGDEALSIADGKVIKVEDTILDGIVVTVSHAEGYISVYKGLDAASVKIDDQIKAGDLVGKVGKMMCEQDGGVHLHVELAKDDILLSVMEKININEDK